MFVIGVELGPSRRIKGRRKGKAAISISPLLSPYQVISLVAAVSPYGSSSHFPNAMALASVEWPWFLGSGSIPLLIL